MRWRKQLPSRPVVPPLLWLTAAGCGMAILSLVFEAEIWSYHPQAAGWSRALLAGLLLAAGIQSIQALWRWPAPYPGPAAGLLWLLRAATVAVIVGITILIVPLLALTILFISQLS